MKLRSKIILGFLATALLPLLLLSGLLYIYLGQRQQSLDAWQAKNAVSSFHLYLDTRFDNLRSAAEALRSDRDFLIATLGGQPDEGKLSARLEESVSRSEFEFALLQVASTHHIIRAFTPDATVAQSCPFPQMPSAAQVGITSLGERRIFAAIAAVPISYKGKVVAQLLVGERLANVIRQFPLHDFDLAAVMVTERDKVVAAQADSQVVELLPQIATQKSGEPLWMLKVKDAEYLVRTNSISGISGSDLAQLSFLLDLSERRGTQTRLFRLYGLLVAAALLVAIVAGLLLSRRLARPLTEMSTAAREIARGAVPEKIIYFPEDEIGDLVGSINRLTEDLEATQVRLRQSEQVAAWQMLARQMAHELKNFLMPLTTAVGHLQKLLSEGRTEPQRLEQISGSIGGEVDRMRRLLASFSEFARLPAPEPRPVAVSQITDSLKSAYTSQLNDGSLSFELSPDLPMMQADSEQLRQVLLNLLANAFEAGAQQVTLKAVPDKDEIVFEIADDGQGIAADTDPFAPLYTTKQGGAGLGLAIVRRIIVDHGGEISHSDNSGGGTLFRFTVPTTKR